MRVQRLLRFIQVNTQGIIPACAGTTDSMFELRFQLRDHPRVCGYNSERKSETCEDLGSSPRVRVQQWICQTTWNTLRIIPACAGTTRYFLIPLVYTWDHPRVCGYNFLFVHYNHTNMGSSPRVRVQPITFALTKMSHGIIPACAGTTLSIL